MKNIKLLRLKLTNFARIKSGMGVNVLELDFKKMPNILSLIVGANGSGKTSLIQCIHPYPYNNCTGDSGGNAQLIVEKMDGEKIFEFEYDDCIYTCTHKYTRKKDGSLSTKSYIAEDYEILDESGSVNSFKEFMADSFGLRESHFSILMIGSSLRSFVSSIASERKRISVKLFEILDIYTFFYRNASDRMRELRPVLQNATAKLAQYRGTNTIELEDEEKRLVKMIADGEQQLATALMELGQIKESMRSNQTAYEEKKDLEDQLRCTTARIDQLRSKAPDKSLAVIQSELEELKLEQVRLQVSYDASAQLVQSELRFKNDKLATITTLRQTSEKIQKDIDIRELEELRLSLSRQIDELNVPPEIDSMHVSSNALLTAKIYLDGLQGRCIDLITNVEHDDTVLSVLDQYKKHHDVGIRLEQEYVQYMQKLQALRTSNAIASILSAPDIRSLFKKNLNSDCDNQDGCPYVTFFKSIEAIVTSKEDDVATKIENATMMVDMSRDRHNAAQTIKKLYQYVEQNKDILSVISSDIFSVDTFIANYMTCRQIYDSDRLNHAIDIAERIERVQALSKELKDVGEKIATLSDNRNSYTALIDQIKELEKDIEAIDFRIASVQKDIDYKDDKLKAIGSSVRSLEGKIEVATQLEELRAKVQDIKARLIENEMVYKELEVMENNYEKTDAYVASVRSGIEKYKKRLEEVRFLQTTIFNLMKEESDISHKLVECQAIKEAVSATDGIPVEFIETFIKRDLIQMVNEILDVVYNGQLVLDKDGTVVDDTDFRIPYFWKGTWVSDISAASDGQKAVMTIAFSEVLVIITQMKYNILMFDEMDARLDARSKAKIIKLMEWYEHQIKPSNMFTISHNPVFDGYPVNILLTSDEVVNNVDSSNVIRCYEGGNKND